MPSGVMRKTLSLALLASLIVILQANAITAALIWAGVASLLLLDKTMRAFVLTTCCLGAGFYLYLTVNAIWIDEVKPHSLHILLNRASLVIMLIPLAAYSLLVKRPLMNYWKKPNWNDSFDIPWIWRGIRRTTVSRFYLIALSASGIAFLPFVIRNGWSQLQLYALFALLFAVINVLEELLWRGVLLSRYAEQLGEKWAVAATSIGFGLQHYALGYPWGACIAFAVGGLYFGGVTVRSGSIAPAIFWHGSINVLMVLSGLVFAR
ncbi:CPBP family intramembrane glutamic endopeptidase [Paenibacillus soyae]|uniref:CPBP family intramembrane metalloprotease n=1 Tax=Paenibacillus soyae TaxID=2969249 RepID=A0A9X2SDK8_9BACL|nr:CPBP family intramembrane glutamic endopeptidase [Paenibacillus soyae]MCR2807998.1 CPBP family intramembrane metalloprotease [Paenibacillus soyae]